MKRIFVLLALALVLPAFPAKAAEPATVRITSMVLRPGEAGVYYKCAVSGDVSDVAAWGVAMSTQAMPDETNLTTQCLYTRTTGTDTTAGTLLTGILKQANTVAANSQNGEMMIYGRPYIETTDGQIIFGEGVSHSLRQLLTAVDAKADTLTSEQKDAVAKLYQDYIGVTHKWALTQLHDTYADGYALNAYDAAVMDTSIQVLEDASYSGLDLANRIYVHAFTYSVVKKHLTDTTPTKLANGTATNTVKKMVVEYDVLTENVLMPGDILYAGNGIYIYGAGGLRSLNKTGAPKVDTAMILGLDTDFTLLRPVKVMTNMTRTDLTAERDELNEYQQAVVSTAKAFWLRGERMQYADTKFRTNGSSLKAVGGEYRWQIEVNTPEDCTATDWGYINCAAFCYDVYYHAFGLKLPDNMYTTAAMAKKSGENGTQVYIYSRDIDSTQTEAEKAKMKEEFLSCIQPGDILVISRDQNYYGHALLYIGNGEIIHASGEQYNYSGSYGVENYEASVRRVNVEDYFFDEEYAPSGYVFTKARQITVLRPLNIFNGQINQNTQNRMRNLEGIVAEKLSSHVRAQTADIGEEITFTYALHNTNDKQVTLYIREVLPQQLEYISGGTRNGNMLTWTATVPAGGRVSVGYTAKVKAGTAYGTLIQSAESTVGGVSVKCEPIRVGKKLTAAQQTALIDAYKKIKANGTSLGSIALLNELYRQATGVENIFTATSFAAATRGTTGFFKEYATVDGKSVYQRNPDSEYAKLAIPGVYGGYRVWAEEFAGDRTRLPKTQDLQIGDVIFGKTLSAEALYLYLGEEIGLVILPGMSAPTVSTATRLERFLAYGYYFVAMRPMQALEN